MSHDPGSSQRGEEVAAAASNASTEHRSTLSPALTTHVLDTSRGRPGAGMRIEFSAVEHDGQTRMIRTVVTDDHGRARLLDEDEMRIGQYELVFHAADYFRAAGTSLPDPPFYDRIPVRFAIADPSSHYHVPLLVSPFGYVTYRGS
jgi:5-hydroxyisourate hydrolase